MKRIIVTLFLSAHFRISPSENELSIISERLFASELLINIFSQLLASIPELMSNCVNSDLCRFGNKPVFQVRPSDPEESFTYL